MSGESGIIMLRGDEGVCRRLRDAHSAQPIDAELPFPDGYCEPPRRQTVGAAGAVSGRGTYDGRKIRTLHFRPAPPGSGWQIIRTDLPGQLPIPVALSSLAGANRAFVLRSGADGNRFRMAEHVICQRVGLGIDDLIIETDSEDPPLFDCGSADLAEALLSAGVVDNGPGMRECRSVKQPMMMASQSGSGFLLWTPAPGGDKSLTLDVAIDFPTAIGRQRLVMGVCPQHFRVGAIARTNCSAREWRMLRCFGWLSRSWRHTGYNCRNILVAGPSHYVNRPLAALALSSGKSLEAVWHRACLDLVAALSLLPFHPAGRITSYCAGHRLDCEFLTALLCRDSFVAVS